MSNNVQPIYNYSIFVCCVECNTEIKFLLNLCAFVVDVIVSTAATISVATVAAAFWFLSPFNRPTQALIETVEREINGLNAHHLFRPPFGTKEVENSRSVDRWKKVG